ncbi:hypothetical protein [Halomicrococcus sp. NG-SE-24]|uniref:hypothetical protein n=1 Tax=Halomicrococcus sp. NG-SE-24 TaxID=3436928 RepID=UPI003D991248
MNVADPLLAALVLGGVWLFVVPVLTLVHELGHAAATLAFTDRSATVVVGGERWRWARGRLAVGGDPSGWRRWWYGFCRYETLPDGRWRELAVHAGGPAATGLAALLVGLVVGLADGRWTRFGLYAAFWNCLFTLAVTVSPIRYPSSWGAIGGHPSDGLRAWRALADE